MRTMSSAAPESAIGSTSSTSRTTVRSGRTTWIVGGGTSGAPLAPGKSAGVSPTFAAGSRATLGAPPSRRRVAKLGAVRVADPRGRVAWPTARSRDPAERRRGAHRDEGPDGDEPDREPAESADELAVGLHDDLLWMG